MAKAPTKSNAAGGYVVTGLFEHGLRTKGHHTSLDSAQADYNTLPTFSAARLVSRRIKTADGKTVCESRAPKAKAGA